MPVALRKESVDRNIFPPVDTSSVRVVALRKESVDRNLLLVILSPTHLKVALRKESVDRNVPEEVENYEEQVALRKESVDRNLWDLMGGLSCDGRSPQGERG